MDKNMLWISLVVLILIGGGIAYAYHADQAQKEEAMMMQEKQAKDAAMMERDSMTASSSDAMMKSDDAMMAPASGTMMKADAKMDADIMMKK